MTKSGETNKMISRETLIQEEKLRNYIRKAIKKINERKTLEENEAREGEDKLRSIIYKLIEADSNVAAPHRSTGINVLEDLLKKIIPQIEIEYKKLTTSPDQRASFRSHIVNAIQNSLAPIKISDMAGSEEEAEQAIDIGLEEAARSNTVASDLQNLKPGDTLVLQRATGNPDKFFIRHNDDNTFSMKVDWFEPPQDSPQHQNVSLEDMLSWSESITKNDQFRKLFSGVLNEQEDIELSVGDEEEEKFVDIEDDNIPDEKEEKEEDFKIDGKDETGRNVAFRAFERIEQAIVDSYNILSNEEDRDLFFDYLITNIKLYFDKFEDEILTMLPEPTTPEYELEKDTQLDTEDDLEI